MSGSNSTNVQERLTAAHPDREVCGTLGDDFRPRTSAAEFHTSSQVGAAVVSKLGRAGAEADLGFPPVETTL